jgi:hypothetical protein
MNLSVNIHDEKGVENNKSEECANKQDECEIENEMGPDSLESKKKNLQAAQFTRR